MISPFAWARRARVARHKVWVSGVTEDQSKQTSTPRSGRRGVSMPVAVLIVAGCAALGALIGVLYPLRPVVSEHRRGHVVAPVIVLPSKPPEFAAPSMPGPPATVASPQIEQTVAIATGPEATSSALKGASSPPLAAREIETLAPTTAALPDSPLASPSVAEDNPPAVVEKPTVASKSTRAARAAAREEGTKRRRREAAEGGAQAAGPPNQQLPIPLIGTLLSLFAPPT